MNTPRLETLAIVEAAVWAELEAAIDSTAHPWKVGVLATRDGDEADARSVVLREFEPDTRTLLIYTDARSPKARQLQAHPQGTLVLWSRELGWQLRLKVALSLETTGLAVLSRWARLKLTPAAQDYLSPLPPGSDLPAAAAATATHRFPAKEGREHFAVLAARVQVLDWLELDARGHRRAIFTPGQSPRWVTP